MVAPANPDRVTVVYDDFSGGDWGFQHPYKVAKNQWHGESVQLQADGSIGPRNPIVKMAPTGLPTTSTTRPSVHFTRDGRVFFIVGANVYWMSDVTAGSVTAATGTLVGGASSSAAQIYTDLRLGRYWINRVGLGLDYMTSGNVITNVPGIPTPFRLIAVKGERMFGASGRILYFSAAGDFTSWPALNQIDLGEGSNIQFLQASGDSLYVGTEASLYVVQGVPGSSTTVRQVAASGAPNLVNSAGTIIDQEPWRVAKLADDTIAWVSGYEDGSQRQSWSPQISSGIASGSQYGRIEISWLRGGNLKKTWHPAPFSVNEIWHVATKNGLLLLPDQAFGGTTPALTHSVVLARPDGSSEYHAFPATEILPLTSTLPLAAAPQIAWDRAASMKASAVAFATRNSSNDIRFYYWRPEPGTLAGASTSQADTGMSTNPYAGYLTLAPYIASDGYLVRVRAVSVFANAYNYTSGSQVIVRSRAMGMVGKTDSWPDVQDAQQTVSFSPTSSPTSIAQADNTVFLQNFGNSPWGKGFTVDLQLTRCSIAKVVVHAEVRKEGNV